MLTKKAVEQRVYVITNLHIADLFLLSTDLFCLDCTTSGPGSSIGIATELWGGKSGVRIPVGTRFSAFPDWPWGQPSLLCNGYRVFPGGRSDRSVGVTPHPLPVPKVLEKSRAITVLALRSCVVYRNYVNLPRFSSSFHRAFRRFI